MKRNSLDFEKYKEKFYTSKEGKKH